MAFKNYRIVGFSIMAISGQLAAADLDAGQIQNRINALKRLTQDCTFYMGGWGDLSTMKRCYDRAFSSAVAATDSAKRDAHIKEAYEWFFRLGLRIEQDRECLVTPASIDTLSLIEAEWSKLNDLKKLNTTEDNRVRREALAWVKELTNKRDEHAMVGPEGINEFYRSIRGQEHQPFQFVDQGWWLAKRKYVLLLMLPQNKSKQSRVSRKIKN